MKTMKINITEVEATELLIALGEQIDALEEVTEVYVDSESERERLAILRSMKQRVINLFPRSASDLGTAHD